MATISKKAYETIATVLSSEMNSLTNGSRAIGTAQGADASGGPLKGDFELKVTFGTAPTAESTIDLFLLRAVDGTSYADGGTSVRPDPATYVGSFTLRNVTTAQVCHIYDVEMPPGLYKAMVVNNSGQSFPASGSTVKVRPYNKTVA